MVGEGSNIEFILGLWHPHDSGAFLAVRDKTNASGNGAEPKSLRTARANCGQPAHARYALIIGENELESGTCNIKDMSSGEQETVPMADAAASITKRLSQ